ncbi:MAG: LacI family DNA-binding transcriptional regulator [Actinomycetota bacterium]
MAERSGVSRATASRALNGDARVSDDTRARVLAAAAAIGYRPNRAARSLANGRSSILGLVMPSGQLVADPYGAEMINSVAIAASSHDQQLMLWLTHEGPDDSVDAIFRNGLVDGVIVSAPALGDDWIEDVIDGPLPTVLIGRHPHRSDINVVDVDNAGGARLAVTHLIERGHRRIATICGPMERTDGRSRYESYAETLRDHGIEVDERLIAQGDYTPDSGLAAMVRLLRHEPTAVFAANDQMALGAYEAIEVAGLRVPDDIAVVGFDGFSSRTADPPLTTVRQDLSELGGRAVELLLQTITTPDEPPTEVIVPVELVVRSSSAGTRNEATTT